MQKSGSNQVKCIFDKVWYYGWIREWRQERQEIRSKKKESMFWWNQQTIFNSLDIILKVMMSHSKIRVEYYPCFFPKEFLCWNAKSGLEETRHRRQVLKDTKMNLTSGNRVQARDWWWSRRIMSLWILKKKRFEKISETEWTELNEVCGKILRMKSKFLDCVNGRSPDHPLHRAWMEEELFSETINVSNNWHVLFEVFCVSR